MSKLYDLGGKTGKLKCEKCGKPRYEKRIICPGCYYEQLIYYVCIVVELKEDEMYYTLENCEYYILLGINFEDAVNKAIYHNHEICKVKCKYEKCFYSLKEFKDKESAIKHIKKLTKERKKKIREKA